MGHSNRITPTVHSRSVNLDSVLDVKTMEVGLYR